MTKGAVVITTIFAPTKTVHEISRLLGKSYDIIVAGDKKSPPDFDVSNVVPSKPRAGDVRYADGSNWNPGSGQGLYIYLSTGAWSKL